MQSKIVLITALIILSCQGLRAQVGYVEGYVRDENHETLPGAHVRISELNTGAATNLEGYFRINHIPVGTYTLEVSFVSFQSQQLQISVQESVSTTLDVTMHTEAQEMEEVLVEAEIMRDNDLALLDMRRKSLQILEGLSVRQMRRLGANDVASAMRYMTGVTVEKGKYIYVRGLGDRYNKAFLNGADIPGLDPNRNTTQMDIFPSYLLNNVVVYKTFSAHLPGDFAGGYVDIETKSVPDAATLYFSSGLGFNANAHLNSNYLTYTGGKFDWLAINDGSRKLPTTLQEGIPNINTAERDSEAAKRLTNSAQSFSLQQFSPHMQSRFLNSRHVFSVGNRYQLLNRPIGYTFTLSYQRDLDAYREGNSGVYKQRGSESYSLTPLLNLDDQKSTEDVLWGALLNVGYRFSEGQNLNISFMHNRKGNKTVRMQAGKKPEDDPDLNYYTQGLWYTQNSISMLQFRGNHTFQSNESFNIKWVASHTASRIYQPDLRFFTYGQTGDDGIYRIQAALGQLPTRYYRDMHAQLSDFRMHTTKTLPSQVSLKSGVAFSYSHRDFDESQYQYNHTGIASLPNGDPNEYVQTENLWSLENRDGVYLSEASIQANSYTAGQQIWASYFLTEIPLQRLTLSAGLRYEGTDLSLTSEDEQQGEGKLNVHDLLPSLSLTYKTQAITLRSAYGRTLARPTFRELAPYASFNFIGDYILVGNPSLTRTTIHNLDLSAEHYPSRGGEMFSVGLFYKDFRHPIERTFNIKAPTPELTFRNVAQAQVVGIETGMKKRLDALHEVLNGFTAGANLTWIYSWVRIDEEELQLIRAYDPLAASTRPMYGQSPYIINMYLTYKRKQDLEATLSYNTFGRRISVITPGVPSIYELPRHDLGVNISKRLNNSWRMSFSVRDILNASYRFAQELNEQKYFAQRYQLGTNYSLSFSYLIEK